jgi:hypothetical protein
MTTINEQVSASSDDCYELNDTSVTLVSDAMFVGGTLAAVVKGIDEDNTATWSSASRPSQRSKTSASVSANEGDWGNWGVANWATLEIKTAIQEIINRGGWSANNALGIVIENTSGVSGNIAGIRSYDYTGNAQVMFQTLTGGHGY